jgi:RNA polymerase sigma-70 factor (ECF subfamily)
MRNRANKAANQWDKKIVIPTKTITKAVGIAVKWIYPAKYATSHHKSSFRKNLTLQLNLPPPTTSNKKPSQRTKTHPARFNQKNTLTTQTSKPVRDDVLLQLLRGTPANQQKGFRILLDQYGRRLYWHIRRLVTYHEDANDVFQNTLVKIYRGIGQFEGKSSLFTWIYRIATNEAMTFLQQKARQLTDSTEQRNHQTYLEQLRADQWFDGDETQARLLEQISLLPDKQRIVFNLRYFEEMPYEEMSQLLDTSVGALKASFHHAVKKVEAALLQ